MPNLTIASERFAIAGRFVIARGAKTHADVLVVTLEQDGRVGRGECVPYARYGETLASVTAAIESCRAAIEEGLDRFGLQDLLPAGAARNALDCALWDLDAKRSGVPALQARRPGAANAGDDGLYAVGRNTPDEMEALRHAPRRIGRLLKIKLAGDGDPATGCAAVRAARAGGRPDRRCERGLAAAQSRCQSRGLCRRRRQTRRTTVACGGG